MNIKITKEQHERLCKVDFEEYLFGSQLHGISNENSDRDFIRVYNQHAIFERNFYSYLPNIHSFQYDDVENNTQYVWMSEEQFWRNLWSGDGNMTADVVILSNRFTEPLHLCYTYKIIKGYLGTGKRDLKLHGKNDKKRFHAYRSFMMAEKLMQRELPTQLDIIELKKSYLPPTSVLIELEKVLRTRLNDMFQNNEILSYPVWKLEDNLLNLQVSSNNIKEFKYD